MRKAAGIIPARWGSTRFPGKPLYLIAGTPLLYHVWERCRRAKKLDSVIIATDDLRIANAAFDWGAEVALTSSRHHRGTFVRGCGGGVLPASGQSCCRS